MIEPKNANLWQLDSGRQEFRTDPDAGISPHKTNLFYSRKRFQPEGSSSARRKKPFHLNRRHPHDES